MKRTGELLRQARESKNLSLNEIALSLKINSKVLSAIENGDLSKLPAKTFLRGFVQSYANYLRTNVDQIMATFTEEMGPAKSNQENLVPPSEKPIFADAPVPVSEPIPVKTDYSAPPASPTRSRRKDENLAGIEEKSRARALFISAICVVLVLFIFVTKRMIDRYQRESVPGAVEISSPLPVPEPPTAVAPGVPPLELPPTESAPTTATPAAEPAPTAAAPVPPPPAEAPMSKPTPPPPAAAAVVHPPPAPPTTPPPPEKKPEVVSSDGTKPSEKEKPEEKKKSAKNLELIIETMDSVEIEYTAADGSSKKISLGPDKVHTIRGKGGLKLNVSNGGAVNLTLNGKDLGVPGDLGKPVKLNY